MVRIYEDLGVQINPRHLSSYDLPGLQSTLVK